MRLLLCKRSRRSVSLLLLSASATLACGGPEVGEIVDERVTLTVQGVASAPEVAAIGEPTGGLGVTRAVLRAHAITLEPCRSGAETLVLAPRAYDLLDDPAPSESISTAVQELCGLQIDIEAGASEAAGVPDSAALYVEARDPDGEALTLTSAVATSLRFETESATSFGDRPLLLGIDVSTWLGDLPLEADLGEQLAEQLKSAAALYVDVNDNGTLDDDERTPLVTSAP